IFKVKNEEARVHFIPTLKDGVFVTLCAPLVIKTGKRAKPLCPKRLECILHSSLTMFLKMSNIKSLQIIVFIITVFTPALRPGEELLL
ncbi:hypothetical protein, partial [Methanosarcina mazei]